MQGEKKATVIVEIGATRYGPYEATKATGRKWTRASSQKRKGAGQKRTLRVGAESVENGTYTFENDGTFPYRMFFDQARVAVWYVTETGTDGDGNPRAADADNYVGKMVGKDGTEVDIENDDDLDYIDVELILQRA